MRIAVTGREGQIARSLVERSRCLTQTDIILVGRPEFDLTDPQSVYREIVRIRPDVVVSAAAYTDVERAEKEPALALAVNCEGAEAVARAAAAVDAPVVHLSTDYVFNGEAAPYAEEDTPAPRSVYGKTKYAGELAVAAANAQHLILRTSGVYSPFGRNFVRTMLALGRHQKNIEVVSDQFGSPTSALDISDALLTLARRILRSPTSDFGLFHLTAEGSTSWASFAEHIFAVSRAAGGPWANVRPIPAASYPSSAARPTDSRLSSQKIDRSFGLRLPEWRSSSASVVRRLTSESAAL